jgi:predicted 3-demethylubiquinone-9 3-methyltransferase (glyoxalase superfamily)
VQTITPFLWFDSQAEEAARFYVSIFPNSKVGEISHYGEAAPMPAGTVMTVGFELDGQAFTALNGGPHFKFNEAVSFVIHCKDQAEIDHYWNSLTAGGGKEVQCGWLTDRFGLSWQVTPDRLLELINDPDGGVRQRVFSAMMQMIKLDLAQIEAAAKG